MGNIESSAHGISDRELLMKIAVQGASIAASVYVIYKMRDVMMPLVQSLTDDPHAKAMVLQKEILIKKLNRPELENTAFTSHELKIAEDVMRAEDIKVSFEDIGGMQDQKEDIFDNIILPIRHWVDSSSQGTNLSLVHCPTGIMLHGKPGTGKTMLAKAIAKESHISFIGIKSATIFSKWVGESDKMVTALFGLARKIAPCVIFIDEVDTVLRKRSSDSGGNNWSASVTGTFLSEWDGLTSDATAPVLVLGATNRPNDIDDAFLRRMPFVVQVSVPTLQTREQILRAMLREEPLGEDVDLQGLASLTEGATGSDLRELCRLAAISRMKCIMTETAATGVLSRVGSAAGASGLGGDKKKAIAAEAEAAGEVGSGKKRKDRPFHMGDFLMALGKMNGQAEQLQQYPKSHW